MESKFLLLSGYSFFFFFFFFSSGTRLQSLSNLNSDASPATAIQLPAASISDSSSSDSGYSFANAKKIEIRSVSAHEDLLVDGSFDHEDFKVKPTKHRSTGEEIVRRVDSGLVRLERSVAKNLNRIQTLHASIAERKKQSTISRTPSTDDDDVVRLLGLGRGPLSFAPQPMFLYGDSFSDHLAERKFKLMFDEDTDLLRHQWRWGLNFSTSVAPTETSVDTFYYDWMNSVMAGREELINVAEKTWNTSSNGLGWKDISHCLLSTKVEIHM